ncbi:MAG: glycosyltransferase family 4 protein [Hyphomicrobiaceae bacterium]
MMSPAQSGPQRSELGQAPWTGTAKASPERATAAPLPAGGTERRLLLVAPTDYDSSVAKGVSSLLHDFDEQGYFAKVVMVFPYTSADRVVTLSDRLVIHEFGLGGAPAGDRPALLRKVVRKLAGPAHVMRVARAIAELAQAEKVTLIRATDPCLSGLVAMLAARRARKPFCVSIHADFDKRHELDPVNGAPRLFGSRRLATFVDGLVLRRADMILPIRDSLIAYAERRGAARERMQVIPHGADLSEFVKPAPPEALSALDLPAGRRIVSFIGRLSPENYIADVLAVGRRLARTRNDAVLVIAGGGGEQHAIEAVLAADAPLASTVRFVGFQPRGVVAALRQASSVALCPMGGFSLIEACAAGAPAVAYDAEWHRELVIDGETGYLVRERDVDGLAHAVEQLLDTPEAAKRMGTRARELAISRHSLATSVARKRQVYDMLIDKRGGV